MEKRLKVDHETPRMSWKSCSVFFATPDVVFLSSMAKRPTKDVFQIAEACISPSVIGAKSAI